MRVELLVNLKVSNGSIVSAGTIYTDDNGPIPDFVIRRLNRGMARVIGSLPSPTKSVPIVAKERTAEVGPEPHQEAFPKGKGLVGKTSKEPTEDKVIRDKPEVKKKGIIKKKL